MIGQDLQDVVTAMVPGFHAVLEGVVGVLDHRDCVLLGIHVEEVSYPLGEAVKPNGLPGPRIKYNLDPLLDDDGPAMTGSRHEHVLLGDAHVQRLFHHPSGAVHFQH